ncbi:MAG: beta-ketoacyl-ACP synthase III [Spirochaetia bacterium]|nr:ketoacyl-ACP synthase III [Spirochaetota bacterium]MCX8097064.1 ketoacyl-ACP synthase III [Spirochaetota bacterium]MDW8111741.1 beta-ketoacyl-ACP synthase III [Spirochaetia bacterium]
MGVKIRGVGMYVPTRVLTNFDLEKMVETSDEWIRTRTGIVERRIADREVASSDLAFEASKVAIERAGISPEDIDLVICATITPDMVFPATAYLISEKLGVKKPGFDINAACSGFVYGSVLAGSLLKSGMYKNILVVGTEVLSKITDWTDRNTCVLFGDGAGAVVYTYDDSESDVISVELGGDGGCADLLYMPAGGSKLPATEDTVKNRLHFIKMNGRETFKMAVRMMTESVEKVIQKAGIRKEDVKLVIPHQANMRIVDAIAEYLGVKREEKVFVNLDKYGNTSAASIPIALAEAVEQGRIQRGDILILVAFGGGFSWGAIALRY